MSKLFAETIKKLRTEKGLSQQKLAEQMFVTKSTVTRWETGTRLPDIATILRLAGVLEVDPNALLTAASKSGEQPHVILVDNKKQPLAGGLRTVRELLPHAEVVGFTDPEEAVRYAAEKRVALAFLEIELRNTTGFDLCRRLLDVNPRTNVVYLTAHRGYALEAWNTGASGFMLKPMTPEGVRRQLKNLRYPFWRSKGG